MEFRDLKQQYQELKSDIDKAVQSVMKNCDFIMGGQVKQFEQKLAEYVGVKHCISCANGTDALQLALMAWDVGVGDAVFVPDFTFFSSGEVVALQGATPIFVDVDEDTFNIDPKKLQEQIEKILTEGVLSPKAIVSVDLFGLPANYQEITHIANKYDLLLLEDGAQGFGGTIRERKACSFGNIGTTSFFPAKPLGCYGDGGAIFTDDDDIAELIRSFRIHGKGNGKYDNIRVGLNSRLDTLQAAILLVKLDAFQKYELSNINKAAEIYTTLLKDKVKTPIVPEGFCSSWAQYTITLSSSKERDELRAFLGTKKVPSMIYYQKPMHHQKAFQQYCYEEKDYTVTNKLCETVLSLPIHPYLSSEEIQEVAGYIDDYKSR